MTEVYVKLSDKFLHYFKWLKKTENKGNLHKMRKLEFRQPTIDEITPDLLTVPMEIEEFDMGRTFHS